ELTIDINNAKKGTDEYITASKKLKEVRANIKTVRTEHSHTGMTLGQLTHYQGELRREISNTTTRGTSDYKKLRDAILTLNSAVRQQRAELNGTQGFLGEMGKSLKGFGVMALGAFGITAGLQGLRMVMGPLISKNAEFSDSLSDVQKTTNLTDM